MLQAPSLLPGDQPPTDRLGGLPPIPETQTELEF